MRDRFISVSNETGAESNIYANKSSVVLDWLLHVGIKKDRFSIREVAKDRNISVGLVQKVFGTLVSHGLLQSVGIRTAKRFYFEQPELLLRSWLDRYNIVKKCRVWTYRTAFQGREEALNALKKSDLCPQVALALHSAAEAYGCKNTNLQTLELYMVDRSIRLQLEETLQLEPQERGYEVLLIEPYYKNLLNLNIESQSDAEIHISSVLLTFLDLYHFPLRGREQAEFMSERIDELNRIYKKRS